MISNNPLMNFARKAELSVRLPSNGGWYEDGTIEYTPNGEVEVYPMLPKDELMMLNPDALLSGQANINLIKSCVPSIKEPEKILYPDANVLFLAIQKATHGDELKMEVFCPKCQEKIIEIKDAEKIAEAEKNGELTTHSQQVSFSIDGILRDVTYLESQYVVELENGLKVYLRPTPLFEKEKYTNLLFNNEKLLSILKTYKFDDSAEESEKKRVMSDINNCYMKMNDIGNNIMTDCIFQIGLPDESIVKDRDMIFEFISNSQSNVITKIDKKMREINAIGLPLTLPYECECCGHTWESKLYGFNQSDFFGIGS